MAVLPETIAEGGEYITEANSLGHVQIKKVLRIIPNKQDSLHDMIEYQSKTHYATAPWVRHKCLRKTFANTIASNVAKMAS